MTTIKSNPVISILRVLSMMLIILAHLSTYLNYGILTQIFNVGVFSFLFISGYLYSNKKINNNIKWIYSRFRKICIPLYIYIIFIILSAVLLKQTNLKYIFVYFINLQGLGFIIHKINFNLLPGTSHLWFLTVLMFCYFLTILMKKIERNYLKSMKSFLLFLLTAVIIHCITSFLGITLNYFIIYFIGYFLGRYLTDLSTKNYFLITLFMVLAMILRLTGKYNFDGTILYNEIIVMLTQDVLSIWIFLSLFFIHEKYPVLFEKTANLKGVILFDNLSYYIYLVHYTFLTGYFSVSYLTTNKILGILYFIVLSFLSAIILKKLSTGCTSCKLLRE